MTRLRLIGSAVLLSLSSMAMADSASQAEQFLKLVHADKLTVPVYAQVQQMLAQRFAQAKAPESKKAVLERYQAKANAELDRAIGWDKMGIRNFWLIKCQRCKEENLSQRII